MGGRQVRVLLGKELRQLARSRTALVTSVVVPILFLVLLPLLQTVLTPGGSETWTSPHTPLPGLDVTGMRGIYLYFTFPLYYALCGVLAPGISGTYTIVAEREQRTVELLMALPVSVGQILLSKLLSNFLSMAATILPIFVVGAVVLQVVIQPGLLYFVSAFVLLYAALALSIGLGLIVALVARDVRTANNLTAVWFLVIMVLTFAADALVPSAVRLYVLAVVLVLLLGASLLFCFRRLTFERYVV